MESRPHRTVTTRNDATAKKVLADSFRTLADSPNTGLFVAHTISSVQSLKFLTPTPLLLGLNILDPIRLRNIFTFCTLTPVRKLITEFWQCLNDRIRFSL